MITADILNRMILLFLLIPRFDPQTLTNEGKEKHSLVKDDFSMPE